MSGGAAGNIHRPEDRQNFTKLLGSCGPAGPAGPPGRKGLLPHHCRCGRQLVSGSDRGGEGGGHRGPHLPDGLRLPRPLGAVCGLQRAPVRPLRRISPGKDRCRRLFGGVSEKGRPAEKIVLGMPLYGYAYQGVSSKSNGLYSTYASVRSVSYRTLKRSYLSNAAYRQLRHGEAPGAVPLREPDFISYDDETSLAAKAVLPESWAWGGSGSGRSPRTTAER